MKIEFAVQMTCESCVEKVQKSLSDLNGISKLDIDLSSGTVLVDTELPQSIIKDKIETTGMRAVLKGYGQMGAAVAMLGGETGFSSGNIKGVIRFVQEEDGQYLIDGEIESPSKSYNSPFNISIYECGDISNNCSNLGNRLLSILNQNILIQSSQPSSHESTIGSNGGDSSKERINIEDFKQQTRESDEGSNLKYGTRNSSHRPQNTKNSITSPSEKSNGHSHNSTPFGTLIQETRNGVIVKTKNKLEIGDIIGRSLVIEDRDSNKLACAVIARSAGVSQNKKVICACDGVTIWEERERPLAGPGRRGEGTN